MTQGVKLRKAGGSIAATQQYVMYMCSAWTDYVLLEQALARITAKPKSEV